MKKTDDETLVKALRLLARDIISEDGIAQSTIREAADRIVEKASAVNKLAELLEEVLELDDIEAGYNSSIFDEDYKINIRDAIQQVRTK